MLNEKRLPSYTQKQIDELNQKNARLCLVIIFDIIYNLYKFASNHPGGEKLIMQAAGDILDEIVQDSNHHFTKAQIEIRLGQYKFGFFVKEADSSNSLSEEPAQSSYSLSQPFSWLCGRTDK